MRRKKIKTENTYYLENHKDISTSVEQGYTTVVVGIGYSEQKVAYEMALKKRTYSVPVYVYDASNRFTQYGYAVMR